MPATTPGKVLTGTRFAIGVTAWVAPGTAGRIFGLDPDANPQAAYLGRLFAVRDAALGVGYLATTGDARRLWWQVGIACDLFDAAAGVLGGRNGSLSKFSATSATAVALAAAVMGAAALAADDT